MQVSRPNLSATQKTWISKIRCQWYPGARSLLWEERRREIQFYSWGGNFLKRIEQLDNFRRQPEGMEGKRLYSLVSHLPFPWLKLVYLDASRIQSVSPLCQKERRKMRENGRSSKRLWFGYQVRLLLPRCTSQMASCHGRKQKVLRSIWFRSFN